MLIARRILVHLGAEHLINTQTTLRKIGEVHSDQLYTFRGKTILLQHNNNFLLFQLRFSGFKFWNFLGRGSSGSCGIYLPLLCFIRLVFPRAMLGNISSSWLLRKPNLDRLACYCLIQTEQKNNLTHVQFHKFLHHSFNYNDRKCFQSTSFIFNSFTVSC